MKSMQGFIQKTACILVLSLSSLTCTQKPKIMTIGGATQDIFIKSDTICSQQTMEIHDKSYLLLQEGRKLTVDDITHNVGGGAVNTALSFNKLGCQTSIFIKIGADPEGEYLTEFLEKNGIVTYWCVADQSTKTARSFILPTPHADTILCCYRGANATIQKAEIPLDGICMQDYVYITSLSGKSYKHLPTIAHQAHKKGTKVAINPGSKQLLEDKIDTLIDAMPSVDIFILNKSEAQILYNTLECAKRWPDQKINPGNCPKLLCHFCKKDSHDVSIIDYVKTIHEQGPAIVVVTNGKEGVYVSNGKKIFFQKSIESDMIASIGAGDAFGSCFVASLAYGKPIETAMLNGAINSAQVIQHTSAHEGQCTFEQIELLKAHLFETGKLPETYVFPLDEASASC